MLHFRTVVAVAALATNACVFTACSSHASTSGSDANAGGGDGSAGGGDASAGAGWVRENPSAGELFGIPSAVVGVSDGDFYVVGCRGIIGHATRGTAVLAEPSGTTSDLDAVWRAPEGDVFAAGVGVVLHSSGNGTWAAETTDTGNNFWITSLWGTSASNVYAVGVSGMILHRHGNGAWTSEDSGSMIGLQAVWGSGPNDIYAAGVTGRVVHSTGDGHWTAVATPPQAVMKAVWGTSPSDVWVAGREVWHSSNRGASWSVSTPPEAIFALAGRGPSDLFALAIDGGFLHGNGATWTVEHPGDGNTGGNLSVASDGTVFAVGPNGPQCVGPHAQVWTTSGDGTWHRRYHGEDLYGVAIADASHIYAVAADGTLLFSTGDAQWTVQETGVSEPLIGVWASPTRVWAVGGHGTILRSSGDGTWTSEASGTDSSLYGVWASSDDDVFAVGGFGEIRHRTAGGNWNVEANGGWQLIPYAVWGSGPDDVYIVGDRGLLLHRTGGSWHSEAPQHGTALNGIVGRNAHDMYIVGDHGLVLRGSGDGSWQIGHAGAQALWSVAASPHTVIAVGDSGSFRLADDGSWTTEAMPIPARFSSVAASGDNMWAVGEKSVIVHRSP
jgi:hypothetical protein